VLVVCRSTAPANDAEFDALFRKHLTGIYLALGRWPRRIWPSPLSGNPNTPCRCADRFPQTTIDGRDTLTSMARCRFVFSGAARRRDARTGVLFA